jgi:hypothetical protein
MASTSLVRLVASSIPRFSMSPFCTILFTSRPIGQIAVHRLQAMQSSAFAFSRSEGQRNRFRGLRPRIMNGAIQQV